VASKTGLVVSAGVAAVGHALD